MGKHSSLGPIDPQFRGVPAHGVVEEFQRAYEEIKQDQIKIAVWQPILAKYQPTLIGECEKAMKWSHEMTKEWLVTGMLAGDGEADAKAEAILKEISDHALTKSHARHLSADKCRSIGLKVARLEDSQEFQEGVLSVHHACIHTLSSTGAYKIIENHLGVAFIQIAQTVMVQAPLRADISPGGRGEA